MRFMTRHDAHSVCVCFLCAIRYTIANIIIEFNIYGSPIPLSAFQFSFPNKLFNVHLILSLYLYLCVQLAFTFRIYSPALFYWQWCTRFCFEVEVTMFALMVTRCILFVFIDLWPWLPDFDLHVFLQTTHCHSYNLNQILFHEEIVPSNFVA